MKRTLIYLVLTSMILHCSARLGLVSYIYENRHVIAFQLGLIDEIPIALCGSSYEFDQGLHIQVPHESDKSLPVSLPQAREINLFIESIIVPSSAELSLLSINRLPVVIEKEYTSPDYSVFHPPAHV